MGPSALMARFGICNRDFPAPQRWTGVSELFLCPRQASSCVMMMQSAVAAVGKRPLELCANNLLERQTARDGIQDTIAYRAGRSNKKNQDGKIEEVISRTPARNPRKCG